MESNTARKLGINNKPGMVEEQNLRRLAKELLEPIRVKYGHAIVVNSAYRCAELNAAVKGSKTSQHKSGSAADIKCTSTSNATLFYLILEMIRKKEITVGQLIWEHGSKTEPDWIHISLPTSTKKNQVIYLFNR